MHTKGPWKVDKYDAGVLDGQGFSIANVDQMAILEDWDALGISHWADAPGTSHFERSEEEVRANTHLIAAAPDLLAVLQDVYHICGGSSRLSHKEQTAVFQRMRQTIAKAKGE